MIPVRNKASDAMAQERHALLEETRTNGRLGTGNGRVTLVDLQRVGVYAQEFGKVLPMLWIIALAV